MSVLVLLKSIRVQQGHPLKGGREHSAFGSVSCTIEVQRGLETRDVVVGVGCPVISLMRNLKVCRDRLFLDCEGEGIVVFILIGILILVIPFHLFEDFDDLVQVSSGDLVRVSGFAFFFLLGWTKE